MGATIRYDAKEARDRINAEERAWLRALDWCQCPRPHLDRAYLGRLGCSNCGRLTRKRSRRGMGR